MSVPPWVETSDQMSAEQLVQSMVLQSVAGMVLLSELSVEASALVRVQA